MAKSGEIKYFKKIGKDAVDHSARKPFADKITTSSLLHDIAAVFSLLPNQGEKLRIIDLGCGTGWTSNFYAQGGHEVVGVDIASEAITKAKQHFKMTKNLKFICADYDSLPFGEEFDVAIFFDSLHHAEDERNGLNAAYNVLKKGGTIIVCEPGLGHSKHPNSIKAVELYNVNERDMPPKLSTKQLKKCGFSKIQTYAYPAMVHRALYSTGAGKTKILRSNAFMRALTVSVMTTIARPWHGIVTAIK